MGKLTSLIPQKSVPESDVYYDEQRTTVAKLDAGYRDATKAADRVRKAHAGAIPGEAPLWVPCLCDGLTRAAGHGMDASAGDGDARCRGQAAEPGRRRQLGRAQGVRVFVGPVSRAFLILPTCVHPPARAGPCTTCRAPCTRRWRRARSRCACRPRCRWWLLGAHPGPVGRALASREATRCGCTHRRRRCITARCVMRARKGGCAAARG
jgi:hypothetical protein